MGEITCPRCAKLLKDGEVVRSFRPPVCPELHGLYLDRWHVTHQFHDHEQTALAAARDAAQPGALPCPTCRQAMRVLVVGSDVEIDGCAACGGYWFDFGELEALRNGSLTPPTQADAPKGLRALAVWLSEALGTR